MNGTPFGAPDQELGVWNVPTEDLVNLLEEMDVNTGVDMERLMECADLGEKIAVRALAGHILRSGPNTGLFDIREPLSFK